MLRGHVTEEALERATEQFQLVSSAYELLSDSNRRHRLDSRQEAEAVTRKWIVNDTVSLSEMNREGEGGACWWYECRCGGVYMVREEQVKEGGTVIGCDTCSLVIEVTQ